jgi:hypothetical protein
VPATLSSKVGNGSLSNKAVMVGLSPLIQPVGLPPASRSILPRGGTSESLAIPSALKADGLNSAAA